MRVRILRIYYALMSRALEERPKQCRSEAKLAVVILHIRVDALLNGILIITVLVNTVNNPHLIENIVDSNHDYYSYDHRQNRSHQPHHRHHGAPVFRVTFSTDNQGYNRKNRADNAKQRAEYNN